ncbi:MAG: hypothetical protein ABSF71_23825 [Terriglobia bacterium]
MEPYRRRRRRDATSRVCEEDTVPRRQGIVAAAKQYGKFVGLPVSLEQV